MPEDRAEVKRILEYEIDSKFKLISIEYKTIESMLSKTLKFKFPTMNELTVSIL